MYMSNSNEVWLNLVSGINPALCLYEPFISILLAQRLTVFIYLNNSFQSLGNGSTHHKAVQLSYLITQKKLKCYLIMFSQKKIKWQETRIIPNKQLRKVKRHIFSESLKRPGFQDEKNYCKQTWDTWEDTALAVQHRLGLQAPTGEEM